MKKSDWKILKTFGVTPDNLTVGGSLDLEGTGITAVDVKKPKPILSWQGGKYIKADNIFSEVIQKRGNVYHLKNIGSNKIIYLVSDGANYFAHGETLKRAKEDLRFKILSEKIKNEPITPDTIITVQSYRIITGACEIGVKMWMQQNGVEKDSYKAAELLPLLEKT